MQVAVIYLQPFRRNLLLKCVLAQNRKKITKTPILSKSLRSFKVIDVDIFKKLLASVCYDKQHVCAYPQPFSR